MKKIAIFLATGFYAGYIPFIPGTIGSLVGLIIYILFSRFLGTYSYLIIVTSVLILGLLSIQECKTSFSHDDDPPQIVIDEIGGFWITMFLIPINYKNVVMGFILFRILDIFKPFPINKLEKIRSPFGIMLDDIMAGILSNLILQVLVISFRSKS